MTVFIKQKISRSVVKSLEKVSTMIIKIHDVDIYDFKYQFSYTNNKSAVIQYNNKFVGNKSCHIV